MGFLKDLGEVAGKLAAVAVSAPIIVVGEMTNSDLIRDIGKATWDVTENTGKLVGSVAESTVKCASGIITKDSQKAEEGFVEVVETSAKTVVGMGVGIAKTAGKGIETVVAIAEGDTDKAIKTGKELVKVAAVSTFAIGVCDIIGGIDADNDGVPDFLEEQEDITLVDNPNMHHVRPHWRTLPDGREIWVDGDGNTNVDTFDGWVQHNPDYRVKG